ncbi:MAG: hypothetical protein WBE26_17080 [Phycisphaerae bacterium]
MSTEPFLVIAGLQGLHSQQAISPEQVLDALYFFPGPRCLGLLGSAPGRCRFGPLGTHSIAHAMRSDVEALVGLRIPSVRGTTWVVVRPEQTRRR